MPANRALKIGITCYASVGGSGVLASALGQELALRGHEVHFISSERPFRLAEETPGIFFHPVHVNEYGLFKYPDYTLPLSVKMAEVSHRFGLDILHVHYAVPHATAAILARDMLRADRAAVVPKVVTTLHGTDTTLLGHDPGYGPAIRHALSESDAVTAVSAFLRTETQRLLPIKGPIEVIHNFFTPRPPCRSRDQVRVELGIAPGEAMVLHISNLRPVKRIDLLLTTAAKIAGHVKFKLVILAGEDFSPFQSDVRRLGLESRVIVRERVTDIEEYAQAADLGLYTSESESFCLGILEGMFFNCPSVSTRVGGIPEVIDDRVTGILVDFGDTDTMAAAVTDLIADTERRAMMGLAARRAAEKRFSAAVVIPQYEALYASLIHGSVVTRSATT
jgi:N-acetyl-alpha-D-glucosaminyl L-malate synthase BshA